jgi:excinuclease UvrABC nuclease subunit
MRIEELEASMLAASDLLAFERAAVLRDELEAACDELESRREAS